MRSAYSHTTDVTSYNRQSQYLREVVNCDKLDKVLSVLSYSYTAPTALGIKVEQIRANVFIQRFKTFFYFVHVFYVF